MLDLRTRALQLLDSTALPRIIKSRFGRVETVGSVALDLMVWEDIDLYTIAECEDTAEFVGLVPEIESALSSSGHQLVRANYNNEYRRPGNPYGEGLYLGLLILPGASRTAWKVDLWGWNSRTFERRMAEHADLAEKLSRADRELILKVKQAVHSRPEYRKTLTSMDVYDFALANAGSSVDDFDEFVRRRRERADAMTTQRA